MVKKQVFTSLLLTTFLLSCEIEKPSLINHVVDGYFLQDEFVFPMNTITQLKMYYQDQYNEVSDRFDEIVISLSKEVDRYHDYEGLNNLKTINDSCGSGEYIKVSKELFELIRLSIELTKLSEGKFNLAMGNIIDLYSSKISEDYVGREDTLFDEDIILNYVESIPSYDIIEDIIVLKSEDSSIMLNKYRDNDVIISLGAIAKGYVMHKAYEYLKLFDYPALFDAGMSTMGTVNNKSKDGWTIRLNTPSLLSRNDVMLDFSFEGDAFISTSGDYQQYFKYKDENNNTRLMHHIIDPYTGISNNFLRSVTLLSKDANLAILDSLSTVIFNCYNDEEILSTIDLFEKTYNCKISYLISKPLINENDVYDYESFNILVSSSFDSLKVGDYSSNVINKVIIDD